MTRAVAVLSMMIATTLAASSARAQNAPPIAHEVHLTAAMQTPATGLLDGSDPNGDPLTFSIATQPQKGTVVLTDVHSGAFTYTPNELMNGADLFTYQVTDGVTVSAPARVSIAIVEAHPENIALRRHAAAVAPAGLVAAPQLVDGDLATSWKSDPAMTAGQIIAINLGEAKRVWRIVIHWAPGRYARSYEIRPGNTVFRTDNGDGDVDDIRVVAWEPFTFLKLEIFRSSGEIGRTYEIQEIELYATETLNQISRNPPQLPQAAPWDATTFAAMTDGDASTGVIAPFTGNALQFPISTVFPSPVINRVVLFWGDDYASHYQIVRSGSCAIDSLVLDKTDGHGGVEVIDLPAPLDSSCVNLVLLDGPGDRFELREVEMYGPFPGNVAAGKNTVASSEASTSEHSRAAVDLDLLTKWVSAPDSGPAWWLVDVGIQPPATLCGIRIWWGDRFPKNYAIFTLAEGSVIFKPNYSTDQGDGGLDFVGSGHVFARYVVIVADPTDIGYSMREFEIYSCPF